MGLLNELEAEHLCTHFVLPLLKLSKFNFRSGGFVDTFLAQEEQDWYILVKLTEFRLLSRGVFEHGDYCALLTDAAGYDYLMYRIPHKWRGDLFYFRCGQYSMMGHEAKEMIRTYSKLPNRVVGTGGSIQTDMRLLALDRNQALKDWWRTEYSLDSFENGELLPKPDEHSYIQLHTLKEQS